MLPSTKAWVGPLLAKISSTDITELIHALLEEIDSCFPMHYLHYFPHKPLYGRSSLYMGQKLEKHGSVRLY